MIDDTILVERCRKGDALAWEALVRRYQGRVYAVACHYLRDPDEARDMAQDVFVKVWEKLDTFSGGERLLPWMLRMARNASIDQLRRRRARPPASDVRVEDAPPLPAAGASPHEEAETAARRRLLWRALGRLSAVNREVLVLKDIQGLTLEEIAALLGVPLGTVKSRSSRARVELAAAVQSLDPAYADGARGSEG